MKNQIINFFTLPKNDPSLPSSSNSSSIGNGEGPRRSFTQEERVYQKPSQEIDLDHIPTWLENNKNKKSLQYHLVYKLYNHDRFDKATIPLIINDESAFNQFLKRFEELEALAGMTKKGGEWTSAHLERISTIPTTLGRNFFMSEFFGYNPGTGKFTNPIIKLIKFSNPIELSDYSTTDHADATLKAFKVGQRNDVLQSAMTHNNQRTSGIKTAAKVAGAGALIAATSGILWVATANISSKKEGSSLQLTSTSNDKKHPVREFLEKLSDLQERAVLMKAAAPLD